jgi:hypothetical protein
VVVILTQLQVGDALDRLVELDASRLPAARDSAGALEARHAELAQRLLEAEARRQTIFTRSGHALAEVAVQANAALAALDALPKRIAPTEASSLDALERELETRSSQLEAQQEILDRRAEYARAIQRVPPEIVARLPDPEVVTGEEAWILCRYRRCYLTDRHELIQAGSKAIARILDHGDLRQYRADEFESLALHFRKRVIGAGDLRWQIGIHPKPHAWLEWRSRDGGIERTRLSSSRALQDWLRARAPDRDFIRFQVWNDSFEVYLEARQVIEAAGFRAGWQAREKDEELDLVLTFGRPPPREGPVQID